MDSWGPHGSWMKLGGLANKNLHVAVAAQAEVHCRDIFF